MKTLIFIVAVILSFVAVFFLTGLIFTFIAQTGSPVAFDTGYQYWHHYRDDQQTMNLLRVSAFLSFVCVLLPVIFLLKPKNRALHGDARFASLKHIKGAGLMASDGIIVARRNNKILKFGSTRHVMMAAPTRSGKGVGVVIPNLFNWKDSVVVLDTKRENWGITATFRKQHGQRVYLFDPVSEDHRTHRWNPLMYVSKDTHMRVNDLQKIASMLWTATEGESGHWDALSRSLFLGVTLYLMDTDELPLTMGEALRQVMKGNPAKHFKTIINERKASGRALAPQAIESFGAFIGYADRTRSSIISSFTSKLELWQNPLVDAATETNDFDFRDLRKKRISIYVGVSPNNLQRMQPVLNLFFQQVVDLNTAVLPEHDTSLKYQCLLLMDEFAALGRLDILASSIAFIAGYGLRLLPIIQSPSQLIGIYGEHVARNFMVNHACKIIFPPSDQKDAQELSDMLGQTTVKVESKGRSTSQGKISRTRNISEQRRALMLPQELREMSDREAIILVENTPPVKANKIRYYEDKEMLSRVANPPPVEKLKIKQHLVEFDIEDNEQETTEERPMNTDDIKNITELTLDDLAVDFSHIEIPQTKLSADQIENISNQFMSAIAS